MQAKAIIFRGVKQVEVVPVEVPEPGPGEVLVETAFSGISPGTELRCLTGGQPGYNFPAIPGYSGTGTAIAAGEGVTIPVGTPVFCKGTTRAADVSIIWGGHVSHAVRPATDVYPLPEVVDLREASLVMLAAIAYHGLRLSAPAPDETVVVVGLGPIGQLSARLHAITGARVVALDVDRTRVEVAAAAGVEAYPVAGALPEAVGPILPQGADVIVDSTGVPAVLTEALGLGRSTPWDDAPWRGPRCLVQGSYPGSVNFDYHTAFMNEVQFLVPRDNQPRDRRAVIDLLARGKLHMADIISRTAAPEAAPEVYGDLLDRKPGLLTAAFAWR